MGMFKGRRNALKPRAKKPKSQTHHTETQQVTGKLTAEEKAEFTALKTMYKKPAYAKNNQAKVGRKSKDDNGFSLLELVVAVSIMLILAVVGFIAYQGLTDNAREAQENEAAANSGETTEGSVFSDSEAEAPAPEPEPSEPITLPEFENGGTILIVLGIVAVVVVGGLVAWRMVMSNRHTSRRLRQEQEAIEADKAKAMASWQKYVDLHTELKNKVYNAETDWDTLFYFPAINDPTVKETQDMLSALDAARHADPEAPASLNLDSNIAEMSYPAAVVMFEKAWNAAWRNAEAVKQSQLTVQERRTINKIMHMLKRTKDGATTESEKQIAFERIDVLLQDLTSITVPALAREVLAKEQQLALEGNTTPQPTSIGAQPTLDHHVNV